MMMSTIYKFVFFFVETCNQLIMKFLIIFLLFCSDTVFSNDNQIVTIALMEYRSIQDSSLSPNARVLANSKKYVDFIIALNQTTNIDMFIFPEATLRNDRKTAVEVEIKENSCDSPKSDVMKLLSCAARDCATYLIVNLVEMEKCDGSNPSQNCQKYGFFYYNTDVIFDRRGTIINKYRKYHLFLEFELDEPPFPEEVIIETDFGTRYGIFTCFDILFKSPAQDLLRKNVDAVIFPTMWFSDLPFLTALQTQQMWAYTHNIKVFSAGANDPVVGSGGSGFYSGDQGMILGDIIATGGSQTYVYRYILGDSPNYNPQKPMPFQDPDILGKQMDNFRLSTDNSIEKFNSTLLDVTKEDIAEEVCYGNELCCRFSIKIKLTNVENEEYYHYRLVAFSGIRSFKSAYNGGIELCGVIACLNSSLSSCGRRFPNYDDIVWPITFEEITIKANFDKDENRTQYPNTLLSSIRPINASQTVWEGKEVTVGGKVMIERRFSLKEAQNRLFTFAIYGRNFGADFPHEAHKEDDVNETGNLISFNWFLTAVAIVASFFVLNIIKN